jgi:threonine 3-dehydrogenase
MGETMLAARFPGNQKVVLNQVNVPEPRDGEVLIRVDSCALCGTDRGGWMQGSPVIPGHETSGTVVRVGPGVGPKVAEGARGVVYLVAACGRCAACHRGAPNTCLRKEASYGFTAPGGFAEYMVLRSDCFIPVDDAVALDAATSLLDLFGTTTHAFMRADRPVARAVAVVGCGPIGLGAIAVARRLRIPVVVGLDVSSYRLEIAARLGAVPFDARADGRAASVRRFSPDGFDVVIEAAGTASTQRLAIDICGPGGVVVIVAHSDETLALRTSQDLIAVERTILGSEYFPASEFAGVHEAVRIGELDPEPILTHRFPLERMAEASEAFFGGETGKVLVRP